VALTLAAGAMALDRSFLDRDAALAQVCDCVRDRAVPDEAEVAATGLHWDPCDWSR
jgi:hypothetical protein